MRRVMKALPLAVAAGVLAVGVSAAPASAHNYNHSVGISGSMYLVDDESWPWSDETGWHSFTGGVVVGGWLTQNSYSTSACEGDEVRGELRVTINDSSAYPGWIYASIDARLYEGTSCSTGDLDGRRTFGAWIAQGTIRNFSFRVSNTDEGGDYIDFNFNIRNSTS